jgi:hypothetical protein
MSFITIAVQCHNFQKRLCWMLSSLAEQTRRDLVTVDVAHMPNNGGPRTEEVIELFREQLSVKSSIWTHFPDFQKRGLIRNRQLTECQTEWLLFSDCDMVYHPEYFERLKEELGRNHSQANYLLSAGRLSNPQERSNALVDLAVSKRAVKVLDAFAKANTLPKIAKRNVGAGYSQIISLHFAPHGGYYVHPTENPDWAWDARYSNPKSDVRFRRRIHELGAPRQKLPGWFSENLIHLNHRRDCEFGRHLEEQR